MYSAGMEDVATIGRSVNDYEGWEVGSSAMEDEDERK